MNWKKVALTVLSSGLLFSGCTSSSNEADNTQPADTSWTDIKEKGEMTVAISGTLFPSNYHGDNNELTGYEVELMNEAAKRLGITINYTEMGTDGIATAVQNKQADAAVNTLQVTEKRKEDYTFSTPTMYSFSSAVVRASDDSGIHSLEDWKGKKAAGGATTTYMQIAEKLGAEPVVYDNATNDVYFRDVASGRTDFIPNNYHISNIAVQEFSDLGVKMSDLRYNPTEMGILFNKDSQALADEFNKVLDEMREDGTLSDLSKEFFAGEDLTQPRDDVDDMPVIDIEEEE